MPYLLKVHLTLFYLRQGDNIGLATSEYYANGKKLFQNFNPQKHLCNQKHMDYTYKLRLTCAELRSERKSKKGIAVLLWIDVMYLEKQ